MSEKKKKSSTVIKSFGGVDHTKSYGDIFSASKIENFRILNDGSLEKRNGFRFIRNVGAPIRALYNCYINGKYSLFVLAANEVLLITDNGLSSQKLGEVGTSSGNACFFFFREKLYLLDGRSAYEYTDGIITPVLGYVPLIAKDWPTNLVKEINEPRNILNRHARATYIVDMESLYLCTVDEVESIEALYVNGTLMPVETYRIDPQFNTVNVKNLKVGDRVEIFFTYKDGCDRLYELLCSSTLSEHFGGIGKNRIFLCGNNGVGTVFSSKNIDSVDLQESKRHYPLSNELYFPVGYEFDAGDGLANIRAMTRFHDRIIIFTDTDVWMVTPDDEGRDFATTTGVNSRIGCPVKNGATLSENKPVSIGYSSVFSWRADSGNRLEAANISRPIEEELDADFLLKCGVHYDVKRNELWLYHKELDKVWIYNTEREVWYSFTGISADHIFDLNGSVAFFKDGDLYAFDNGLTVDYDNTGIFKLITAVYTSNFSELGISGRKNLSTVTICAQLFHNDLKFLFEAPPHEAKEYVLKSKNSSMPSTTTFRYPTGRFSHASFSFISYATDHQKISSLTLTQR